MSFRSAPPRPLLAALGPLAQLRAGRLGRRLPQLFIGLWLYGFAMALFVRSGLGLDPWDVLHAGIQRLVGWSFGTVVIVVGFAVLLLWIPLRQAPGLGTIANAVVIGLATDATLAWVPPARDILAAWTLLVVGVVVNGLAGALYIGAQLGPGPRDGLMTGIARRTGWSLRLVRTGLELGVLLIGWALGGLVGIGTLVYAVSIGPLVQLFLPYVIVTLGDPSAQLDAAPEAPEPAEPGCR